MYASVQKDLQVKIVETKHASQTVVNLGSVSMAFANVPQVIVERHAVAHVVRMALKSQAQRFVSVNPDGLDHFVIGSRAKLGRMEKSVVGQIVVFALRESVCACPSFLGQLATTNLALAHELISCVRAKVSATARLENAFATTQIKTLDLAVNMKNVPTTVLGMELVIRAPESVTAAHAMIAPRHGLAKIAARQRARTRAITMVNVSRVRATAMKASLVTPAM